MILTVQLQLLPDEPQIAILSETVERFNEAANWLAGVAFDRKSANKFNLQKVAYRELRDRFGLPAEMAIRCIAQVCEAYKRDKSIRPLFRPDAAIPYTYNRNYSFKGIDIVSISTLHSRLKMPFIMGKYQRDKFANAKGQADLICRSDGKWFLLVTVDLPGEAEFPATDFVGVDLGIVQIATVNDGETFSGKPIEENRRRSSRARQTYQRRNTRSSRRRLRKMAKRQSRYQRDMNHCIAKKIVAKAKALGVGIGLEDLSGIRDRCEKTANRALRRRLGNWGFYQLRQFIIYKAKLAGVPVVLVDPRYTSQTCHKCGHCERSNRKSQASFVCKQCGHSCNADQNGAENIRSRALGAHANRPHLAVATA